MPVDVLLVEDQKSLQGALAEMLAAVGDFRVVATMATEAEALDWLDHNPGQWGLAVVDLVLEQGSGMGVVSRCRRSSPEGQVVVFSNFVTPVIRDHCIRLGADAAFEKNAERTAFTDYCAAFAPKDEAV